MLLPCSTFSRGFEELPDELWLKMRAWRRAALQLGAKRALLHALLRERFRQTNDMM